MQQSYDVMDSLISITSSEMLLLQMMSLEIYIAYLE